MKAIFCPRYGSPDVLQLQEVATPAPREDEVLIEVIAASLNSRDARRMRGNPFFLRLATRGFLRPKNPILGADVAGRVVAVGGSAAQFKPGSEVFGVLSRYGGGTLAEYVCAGENEIALKPANCSFEQAAAVPLAAMTALQGLRSFANLQPGEQVLVYGASGGVGTYAVQIAKALGARVTAVCSPKNMEMLRSLGAERIIDYTRENLTQIGSQFDLILAVNGYQPIGVYLRLLKPEGVYVVAGGSLRQLFEAALKKKNTVTRPQTHILSLRPSLADLVFIQGLLEDGKISAVIDGCYPLGKVQEAFRYFENTHPRGKVIIRVA